MATAPLMSIGRFARACRLSIKALRLYDELDLLRPARVDRSSGYRYYASGQARRATIIAMLRSFDVPLEAIRTALSGDPASRQRVMKEQQARVRREIVLREHALLSLDRLLEEQDLMPYHVSVRNEPERLVARAEETMRFEDQEAMTATLVGDLTRRLAELDAPWSDPIQCLILDRREDQLDVAVCVTIERPIDGVAVAPLRGGPVAMVRHVGPYGQLGLARFALLAWVQEQGHAETGPLREIYINDPADTPPDALVTEVVMPIDAS